MPAKTTVTWDEATAVLYPRRFTSRVGAWLDHPSYCPTCAQELGA